MRLHQYRAHPTCVEVDEQGKLKQCRKCSLDLLPSIVVITDAPKGARKKTTSIRSTSSHSSRTSQSIQLELKLLEEQRKLEVNAAEQLRLESEKQFYEKQQAIKAKLAKDLEYLKQKSALEQQLENFDNISERSSTSSKLRKERVEGWKTSGDPSCRDQQPSISTNQKEPPSLLPCRLDPPRVHFDSATFQVPQGSSTFNCTRSMDNQDHSKAVHLSKEILAARNSDMRNLPQFSGKVKEWPVFIRQFEESTLKCQFTNSDNIVRLRNCLKGNARNAVLSALSYPENVSHIIKTLANLFGRPEFILNELIQEARQHQSLSWVM